MIFTGREPQGTVMADLLVCQFCGHEQAQLAGSNPVNKTPCKQCGASTDSPPPAEPL